MVGPLRAAPSRWGSSRRRVARLSLQPSRDPADYAFSHRLRTRFAETDAMGVVHHAAYLPYLEEARVEYLRSIGHPYDAVRSGDDADAPGESRESSESSEAAGREFPVLEVSLQYRRPLRFDDEVDVALRVGAITRTTFQIAYLVSVGGEVRATAVTVHGCIDGRGRPARLPHWVAQGGRARGSTPAARTSPPSPAWPQPGRRPVPPPSRLA